MNITACESPPSSARANDADTIDGWPSGGSSAHRPPLNVVVFKGTPESGAASDGSIFTTLSNNGHHTLQQLQHHPTEHPTETENDQYHNNNSNSSSSTFHRTAPRPRSYSHTSSSPFKLMPRTSIVYSPATTASRGPPPPRGRKRRAQSISSPSSRAVIVPSSDESATTDREDTTSHEASASSAMLPPPPPVHPLATTASDGLDSMPSYQQSSPSLTLPQRKFSTSDLLTMRSLSLQSPVGRKPTFSDTPRSPPILPPQHNRTSSFSLYSSASPSSINHIGTPSIAGSVNSALVGTPCSSASPRQVPLTVLSNSQGRSPMKGRRPFYGTQPSSLLQSLDGKTDADEDLPTPTRLIESLEQTMVGTPNNEPRENIRPTIHPRIGSSSGYNRTYPSDDNTSVTSSIRTPGRTAGFSPRTPLPRINLTPKTPKSGSDGHVGLPFSLFASPADDGIDMTTTPHNNNNNNNNNNNGSFTSTTTPLPRHYTHGATPFSPHDRAGVDRDIAKRMDSLLGGFPTPLSTMTPSSSMTPRQNRMTPQRTSESSMMMMMTTQDMPSPANGFILQSPHYLDDTNNNNNKESSVPTTTTTGQMMTIDSPPEKSTIPPTLLTKTPQRNNRRTTNDTSTSIPLSIQTKSVLAPSQSNGYLEAMMRSEARQNVLDAETGTLSDSDDDDDFVLTTPADLSVERTELSSSPTTTTTLPNEQTRARQRRRRSYEKLPTNAGLAMSFPHCSNGSLTSSHKASNTSLFGMDLIQEENQSMCSGGTGTRATTPYSLSRTRTTSGSTLSRRDSDVGDSSSWSLLQSRKSEHSLGLSIEESTAERDLITPPITIPSSAMTPPPLPLQGTDQVVLVGPTQPSVCVSAADRVSETIARMATTSTTGQQQEQEEQQGNE